MLEDLIFRNVGLFDEIEIPFKRGLNILTGETGAGKTAIISALCLLLGDRYDPKVIRSGALSATIQAIFSIKNKPHVKTLLQNHSIPFDDTLTIRREIQATGKNQLYIQDRLVTLNFAKELGNHLIEIISQHSHLKIRNASEQLKILDTYGEIDTKSFQEKFTETKTLETQLLALKSQKLEAATKLEKIQWDLSKINELNPQENEEEELFSEYKSLNEKQELATELSPLNTLLTETLLPSLSKYRDLNQPEIVPHLKTAENELLEAAYQTSRQLSEIEYDPTRLAQIEKRLTELNDAKKRFGDPLAYKQKLESELNLFENLDEQIDSLEKNLTTAQIETDRLAAHLTQQRTKTAQTLSVTLTSLLQTLNMPGAQTEILLEQILRSPNGDERAQITLSANPGEKSIPIAEGASGGEISRLYFCLKTLIATKEQLPTLLFDEIDANIGGETATLFGEKLQQLGSQTQIISITHFPQVARFADHHLKIQKITSQNRTTTHITPLDSPERQQELLRMLGGKSFT